MKAKRHKGYGFFVPALSQISVTTAVLLFTRLHGLPYLQCQIICIRHHNVTVTLLIIYTAASHIQTQEC